jgi:hypothetical protein
MQILLPRFKYFRNELSAIRSDLQTIIVIVKCPTKRKNASGIDAIVQQKDAYNVTFLAHKR